MALHTVEQGECISSIAKQYGVPWEIVWDHPDNAALREKRIDPNVLYPGDTVSVPDRDIQYEPCATDQRHNFKMKSQKAKLRLRLFQEDKPRAGEAVPVRDRWIHGGPARSMAARIRDRILTARGNFRKVVCRHGVDAGHLQSQLRRVGPDRDPGRGRRPAIESRLRRGRPRRSDKSLSAKGEIARDRKSRRCHPRTTRKEIRSIVWRTRKQRRSRGWSLLHGFNTLNTPPPVPIHFQKSPDFPSTRARGIKGLDFQVESAGQ